ncbi:MAG: isoprenylcysteine carboxylmethyltransferase family protein [Chloroflexota bacterium]
MIEPPTRIPSLGPRGEGWVAAQIALFVVVAGFGVRDLEAGTAASLMSFPAVVGLIAVGAALLVLGGVVAVRAMRDLGRNLSPFPRPLAGSELVETGLYRLVRHPIYSGLILAGLGWSVATASGWAGLSTLALAVTLDLKARREETWLGEALDGYPAYRARTKRLIPFVY